jgi:hypothetical protein
MYRRIDMGTVTEEKLEDYGKEQEAPQEAIPEVAQEPETEEVPEDRVVESNADVDFDDVPEEAPAEAEKAGN